MADLRECPFCGRAPLDDDGCAMCMTDDCALDQVHIEAAAWNRRAEPVRGEDVLALIERKRDSIMRDIHSYYGDDGMGGMPSWSIEAGLRSLVNALTREPQRPDGGERPLLCGDCYSPVRATSRGITCTNPTCRTNNGATPESQPRADAERREDTFGSLWILAEIRRALGMPVEGKNIVCNRYLEAIAALTREPSRCPDGGGEPESELDVARREAREAREQVARMVAERVARGVMCAPESQRGVSEPEQEPVIPADWLWERLPWISGRLFVEDQNQLRRLFMEVVDAIATVPFSKPHGATEHTGGETA